MFYSRGKVAAKSGADGKKPAVVLRPSVFAQGITITGDIYGDGELVIEGRLNGSVRCKALTVGATGSVRGRIVADTVLVMGVIEGEVAAGGDSGSHDLREALDAERWLAGHEVLQNVAAE